MKIARTRKLYWIVMFVGVMIVSLFFGRIAFTVNKGISLAKEIPFLDPPEPFDENLLSGNWKTEYMEWGNDLLIIRPNGTFKQVYRDKYVNDGNYIYETLWNNWWVERLPDERMYLHLEGAKYFLNGVSFSEKLNGFSLPCSDDWDNSCENGGYQITFSAYDWIRKEYIEMTDELILNIRADSSGIIVLVHMWSSSDAGFPIIGGESGIFRKEP